MCYPVCEMMHNKNPMLIMEKCSVFTLKLCQKVKFVLFNDASTLEHIDLYLIIGYWMSYIWLF